METEGWIFVIGVLIRNILSELLAALGYEVKSSATAEGNKESSGSPARSKAEKGKSDSAVDGETDAPVVSSGTEGSAKKVKVKKERTSVPAAAAAAKKSDEVESPAESASGGARPKDQLIYLSKIIGFKVRVVFSFS